MGEYLKCDARDCEHIEHVDSITEAHVDMPCPKCGESLLTRADWDAWQPMKQMLRVFSSLNFKDNYGDEKVAIRVGVHGQKTTLELDTSRRELGRKRENE